MCSFLITDTGCRTFSHTDVSEIRGQHSGQQRKRFRSGQIRSENENTLARVEYRFRRDNDVRKTVC